MLLRKIKQDKRLSSDGADPLQRVIRGSLSEEVTFKQPEGGRDVCRVSAVSAKSSREGRHARWGSSGCSHTVAIMAQVNKGESMGGHVV